MLSVLVAALLHGWHARVMEPPPQLGLIPVPSDDAPLHSSALQGLILVDD